MMDVLLSIGVGVFVSFLAFILIKFGLIPSLSDSAYFLNRWKSGTGFYFSIWCALVVMFVIAPGLEAASSILEQVLTVIMCLGLIFVGAAPEFKSKKYRPWHIAGAVVAAMAAIAIILIRKHGIIIARVGIPSVLILLLTKKKDSTLWLEVACFISYFISTFKV